MFTERGKFILIYVLFWLCIGGTLCGVINGCRQQDNTGVRITATSDPASKPAPDPNCPPGSG